MVVSACSDKMGEFLGQEGSRRASTDSVVITKPEVDTWTSSTFYFFKKNCIVVKYIAFAVQTISTYSVHWH